jgi:UbiD family decarboxylase
MKDLRSFIDQIARAPGQLLTTDVPVDPKLELTRIIYKLEQQNQRPAVLFKKVRGSDLPVLTNLFGNRERVVLARFTGNARKG